MIYSFSPSHDFAPPPSPPVSKLSLFLSLPVELSDGKGGGGRGGANSYGGEKAWSSINHSILFALNLLALHYIPLTRFYYVIEEKYRF
jgi:hypothetical protein